MKKPTPLHLLAFACLLFMLSPLLADSTVVFNEVMYHPAGDETALEWMELYNQMAVDMDISGWRVTGGAEFMFPEDTIVPGGGFVLIARDPAAFAQATGIDDAFGPFMGELSNNGQTLELQNNNDRRMDRVAYRTGVRWPVAANGAGVSLAKINPDLESGTWQNWAMSRQVGGTPGAINFPSDHDPAAIREGLVSFWRLDDESLGGGGYTEDFAESNGTPADWIVQSGDVSIVNETLRIRSNQGVANAWAGQNRSPIDFSDIHAVTFQVDFVGQPTDAVGRHGGIMVCAEAPADRYATDCYVVDWIDRTSDRGYRVYKSVNGQHTMFESGSGHAEPGTEWRIEFDANAFRVIVDGETIGTYQDASFRSGHVGVWCYSNTGEDIRFDDVQVAYEGLAMDDVGGNHGTAGGDVTQADGLLGTGAIHFNGSEDAFVDVGAGVDDNFSVTTGITIEALIQTTWDGQVGNTDIIFEKDDNTRPLRLAFQHDDVALNRDVAIMPAQQPVLSFGLTTSVTYTELDMPLDGADGRPALATLTDGEPHHVVATYHALSGAKKIYVDGELCFQADLAPGSGIRSGGPTHALIGNSGDFQGGFTGIIDEVAFWEKALSAQDVARHWANVQAGLYYLAESQEEVLEPRIAFNETSLSDQDPSWVELVNHGAVPMALEDMLLVKVTENDPEEYTLPDITLSPGDYLVLSEADIGFDLLPADMLCLYTPDRQSIAADVLLADNLRGRHPEGDGLWRFPDSATPNDANSFAFQDGIVITEIMYHPMVEVDEYRYEYIEIYNRSGQTIDLSGYHFANGVDYLFPQGIALAAGAYLVVAADPNYIAAEYGIDNVVGPYVGRLGNATDRIELADAYGNPVDEVRYYDGGRWPAFADGGGSSLELRDIRADNANPAAWAASQESHKAEWQSITYEGVAANNRGPTQWNEFVMGLLARGEVLLDDIHVVERPDTNPIEFIQNGTFEGGDDRWRFLGTHRHHAVIDDPDQPGNRVLHLRASGATEHMHNHAETTFANGERVVNGRPYRISFRAKWLGGCNKLNTRLYFNRLPRTTILAVPGKSGTPGRENSVAAANIGPALDGLEHSPVVPEPGEPVTVWAAAEDPDGVAGCTLSWSVNEGEWQSIPMTQAAPGLFQGATPGYNAGDTVQFYVTGLDTAGATAMLPAAGPDSRALYKVNDGQANLARLHNIRIIMVPSEIDFLHRDTNVMSNDRLGATIVYDEKQVTYDAGVRLRSSQRGRNESNRVGFSIAFPPDRKFRGVHPTIGLDRSGGWGLGISSGLDEVLIKHIANHAGGIPCTYDDIAHVIAPRSAQNGPVLLMMARFNDVYLNSQYQDGAEGPIYNYELIYYPTSTTDGNPESLKRPRPDSVTGQDIHDMGDDKEIYRWFFSLENNRNRDEYDRFIQFCKTFSASRLDVDDLNAIMDVDEWMRTFTIYSLCGVRDAYTYGNYHNCKIYVRPGDQRVLAFPWDLDWCWTSGTETAGPWGGNNLSRIIQLAPFQRMYWRHLKDIMTTTYDRAYMDQWITHYGSLAGQNYSRVSSYINTRRNYLMGRIPNTPDFAIITNSGQDFSTEADAVLIEGNAPIDVGRITLNGLEIPVTWHTLARWSIDDVPLAKGPNVLEFSGLDTSGGVFASATITITNTSDWNPPEIHIITPTSGPATGGTDVQIYGLNFHPDCQVMFGGQAAAAVTHVSEVNVVATSPAGTGDVTISVRNPDGLTGSAPMTFTYIPVGQAFQRGDANTDGKLDLSDAITILSYLFSEGEAVCLDALDVNDDGSLDLADAISHLSYSFAEGDPPEPPFGECGLDPTDDNLDCEDFPDCD